MRKRGVSLIVLIVSIIVIIILAAVVILTLSKNNPIESAKEARFKEDVRTFQDELAMYISKDYTNKAGQRDEKIIATNYNPAGDPASVYTYISSFSKKYEGKFVIKNDELMYSEGKLTEEEQKWSSNLNINLNKKTQVEKVEENPEDYYGKKLNYTAPNGVNDWKIFYSDGRGIYLITSEYVDPTKLPEKDGVKPDQGNTANYPKAARFNNIITKYNGSSDITDEKMKAFNRDYFDKNYTSGNNINFKAVAYMLDKEIWSELYADSSVAEYAVGGPSVEMLLKSYCITHSEKQDLYKSRAANATGYEISKDGGINWANNYQAMLETNLYVLPLASISGANAMWLASPSACGETYVMSGGYYGYVTYDYYSDIAVGFRPLVYLNSDINLKWNDTTQKYDIE